MNTKTVKLKNGTEETAPLVATVMMSLNRIYDEKPIALYELACFARDPDHVIFGNSVDTLKEYSLIGQDGQMDVSTRNIVLSAVRGEGLEMKLASPLEKDAG